MVQEGWGRLLQKVAKVRPNLKQTTRRGKESVPKSTSGRSPCNRPLPVRLTSRENVWGCYATFSFLTKPPVFPLHYKGGKSFVAFATGMAAVILGHIVHPNLIVK